MEEVYAFSEGALHNPELASKSAGEQTDVYPGEEFKEEKNRGTKSRRDEEMISSLSCEALNRGALQARETRSKTSAKRKAERQQTECLSEAVDEEGSPCDCLEQKKVATVDSALISSILPRSISKAIDKCNEEQRTMIASDDLIEAATSLGCDDFLESIRSYIQQHVKPEEGDSHIDVHRPGCEDWYSNLQDLLKMVPRQCSACCPCRLVRFTKDNYK